MGLKISYDVTRTFLELARGPAVMSGMGQAVHSWGRRIAEHPGGSLVTGLPATWVQPLIDTNPVFDWMKSRILTTGTAGISLRVFRAALTKSGFRRDLPSRAMRAGAFRMGEAVSRRLVQSLWKAESFQSAPFIYHIPLPEVLPSVLPTHCRPVVNIYDIMPIVFRDTYSKSERREFLKVIRSIKRHDADVVVNSSDTRHSLICSFDLNREKVHVVPLGSDPVNDAWSGHAVDDSKFKVPYWLYVAGAGQRRKNIAGAIEGFREFLQRAPGQADLVITGHGTDHFQALADRRIDPARGKVHCLGQVTGHTLAHLYQNARAGLYLSLYEGFGLPILECMHRGLPVVCGQETSLPEVAGDAAVLVDAMDPPSMGAGMAELWSDSVLRETLIQRGRERAMRYSWAASFDCLLAVYDKILASSLVGKAGRA